jgi:hypothetical protein
VSEDRVLRKIFGPRRGELTEGEENCIQRGFVICTPQKSIISDEIKIT